MSLIKDLINVWKVELNFVKDHWFFYTVLCSGCMAWLLWFYLKSKKIDEVRKELEKRKEELEG